MSDLGQSLIKAFASFRTDPQGVEKALEAFVDERIALAKKSKPRERKAALGIDGFVEWYAAYPRRIARKAAARAYTAARREVDREVLLAGAKRYAGQVAGTKMEHIKMPATWLNGGCWADEYPVPVAADGSPAPRKWEPESVWFDRLRYYDGQESFPKGYWRPDRDGLPPPQWPDDKNTSEEMRAALRSFKAKFGRWPNNQECVWLTDLQSTA